MTFALRRRGPWAVLIAIAAATLAAVVARDVPLAGADVIPPAPAGMTAIALDGKVDVAWQAADGATSYSVYRGTSAGSITDEVGTGVSTTDFDDTTAVNGTTYYYAVRAVSNAGESQPSQVAQATPRTAS